MSLSQYSLSQAYIINKELKEGKRNEEAFIAMMVQKAICNWVERLLGKKSETPLIKGGLLGIDPESVLCLVQCGIEPSVALDDRYENFEWYFNEEDQYPAIKCEKNVIFSTPYWASFSLHPKDRKKILLANEETLLLGDYKIHPRSDLAFDCMVGIGSLIAQNTVIWPRTQIGRLVTIASNVTVASGTIIGDCVSIGANSSIGNNVTIGTGCSIGRNVVIYDNVHLEADREIQSGQIIKYGLKV